MLIFGTSFYLENISSNLCVCGRQVYARKHTWSFKYQMSKKIKLIQVSITFQLQFADASLRSCRWQTW